MRPSRACHVMHQESGRTWQGAARLLLWPGGAPLAGFMSDGAAESTGGGAHVRLGHITSRWGLKPCRICYAKCGRPALSGDPGGNVRIDIKSIYELQVKQDDVAVWLFSQQGPPGPRSRGSWAVSLRASALPSCSLRPAPGMGGETPNRMDFHQRNHEGCVSDNNNTSQE